MSDKTLKIGGLYKHYENKMYRVVAVVKHSETLEDLVMYQALYDNTLSKHWVRPVEMFLEDILVDGVSVPRFELQLEEHSS